MQQRSIMFSSYPVRDLEVQVDCDLSMAARVSHIANHSQCVHAPFIYVSSGLYDAHSPLMLHTVLCRQHWHTSLAQSLTSCASWPTSVSMIDLAPPYLARLCQPLSAPALWPVSTSFCWSPSARPHSAYPNNLNGLSSKSVCRISFQGG